MISELYLGHCWTLFLNIAISHWKTHIFHPLAVILILFFFIKCLLFLIHMASQLFDILKPRGSRVLFFFTQILCKPFNLYTYVTLYIFCYETGTLIRKLLRLFFFYLILLGSVRDLKHHSSTIFNAVDISSFAWRMQHRCHKMSSDHSPLLPC